MKPSTSCALCAALLGSLLLIVPSRPAQADPQVIALLNKVQEATETAKTLTADFSYTTSTTKDDKTTTKRDFGTVRLMKPNYADIVFDPGTPFSKHIVSDGTTLWTYSTATNTYTKTVADPQGKNINVWRLITIGGFFSVSTWIRQGVYVSDLDELTYAGRETIDGTPYQVLQHKMIGTVQGQECPFDQKVFIGPDTLIRRFTLALTVNGKPGSELAELTSVKIGQAMTVADFAFAVPDGAQEQIPTP